jgi:hypothetical protein
MFNDKVEHIDKHTCSCDLKTFSQLYSGSELSIYAICVEPTGDTNLKDSFDKVCLFLKTSNIDFVPFTIFRNVFDRHYSEYMYLNSNISKHEKSHGTHAGMTFDEYIQSVIFPYNYMCQTVQKQPSKKHMEYIIDFFKTFKVLDMSNITNNLFDILNDCHGNKLDYVSVFSENNINANKNIYDKITIDDLSEKSQEVFLFKTSLDRKLYNAYIS